MSRIRAVACVPSILMLALSFGCQSSGPRQRWSLAEAEKWGESHPWPIGCNYTTSTAINQLEMFQADTYDPETIDRELGWASELGFNTARVYLHDLLWTQDAEGFLDRVDSFLSIAHKHRIGVMLVLLDGVWDPLPKIGKQREPRPHVHNSGWVQSPGAKLLGDPSRHDELESYIKGVVTRFRTDERVLAWDVFNEPENDNRNSYRDTELENKGEMAFALLRKTVAWVREVGPLQPITMAPWHAEWGNLSKVSEIDRFMLTESDIITFHNYSGPDHIRARIRELKKLGRPLICTEYMARPTGSTFENILPILEEERVGGCSWGFVAGKSQTIYPWDSWRKEYTAEPALWFHDILRSDGTPYREEEVELIRRLTARD